jgi:ribosomal-protein-alanine N-acetyltransferase
MDAPAELRDGEVLLSQWSERDLPLLQLAASDPEITRVTAVPHDYSSEAARAFVTARLDAAARGEALSFTIRAVGSAGSVGAVNLSTFDWDRRAARIGYWLVGPVRGQGLATRAVRLLTQWAVAELGLREIELRVEQANHASLRVAEVCGYVRVGEITDAPSGTTRSLRLLRLLYRAAPSA